MEEYVAAVDEKVSATSGGTGSLSVLCNSEYELTRRLISYAVHEKTVPSLVGSHRSEFVEDQRGRPLRKFEPNVHEPQDYQG